VVLTRPNFKRLCCGPSSLALAALLHKTRHSGSPAGSHRFLPLAEAISDFAGKYGCCKPGTNTCLQRRLWDRR
jgi:hypothetical protein